MYNYVFIMNVNIKDFYNKNFIIKNCIISNFN